MNAAPVPSLDELATDPAKVAGLPPEARQALALQCAAVLAAVASGICPLGPSSS